MFIKVIVGVAETNKKETYRAAEVLNVLKCAKIYELGSTRTNQALNVKIGNSKRGFRLNYISNQPFTESEFQFYKQQMEKNNLNLPNLKFCKDKAKEIDKLKKDAEQQLTTQEFERMVENKKKFRHRPTSFARKKSALIKQLQEAEQSKDMLMMNRLNKELADLDNSAEKIDTDRIGSQCNANAINDKIRATFNNAAKQNAVIRSNKEYRDSKQVNPFMRRKTTPMMGNNTKIMSGLGDGG